MTAGTIAAAAAVCYGINGVATIFPPAAALLPYCPFAGALVGNPGLNKTIDVAKHIPVKQSAKFIGDTTVYVLKDVLIKPGIKIVTSIF